MKIKLGLALACLVALTIGCGRGTTETGPTQVTSATDQDVAASTSNADIGLELLSIKDLPTQLAARAGKVVILDMWATW